MKSGDGPDDGRVLAQRGDTVLVDGTLALPWDWRHRDDLFSGKHRDSGFNLQVAATLDGQLLAVGEPVPGKRALRGGW